LKAYESLLEFKPAVAVERSPLLAGVALSVRLNLLIEVALLFLFFRFFEELSWELFEFAGR